MRFFWAPFSILFAAVSYIRWILYKIGILRIMYAPAPVISIGNIALGGTGKTPCVIWLAGALEKRGFEPIILIRGFKRKAKERMLIVGKEPAAALAGDEAASIARRLPNILIAVDKDRYGMAKEIGGGEKRVFILDDGFQHLKLHRDCDIVLLPSDDIFSGEHFAPWGRLRDGKWRLEEADAIILTGEKYTIKTNELPRDVPIFRGEKRFTSLNTLSGKLIETDIVRGKKVVAFAGIGQPSSFRRTLESNDINVVRFISFRDHHNYSVKDIHNIEAIAEEEGVDILLTTEKDAMRLAGFEFRLSVYVVRIDLYIEKEEELLNIVVNNINKS